MKTIYLFRHSKPVKQGQFANSDIPLSAEGKEKILNLATEMQLGCNLKIYTSPYRRAFETAELIACKYTAKEMAALFGADSVGFLPLEDVRCLAKDGKCKGYCAACFDGKYPTDIPQDPGVNKYDCKISENKN